MVLLPHHVLKVDLRFQVTSLGTCIECMGDVASSYQQTVMARNRVHAFVLLILVQGGCLAVGMWLRDRFFAADTTWRQTALADDADAVVLSESASAWIINGLTFLWSVGTLGGAGWLFTSRIQGEQDRQNLETREEALRRARELEQMRDAVIFGLAKLAESRDPDTGMHLERISLYSTRLARAARKHPRFKNEITPGFVQTIGVSSALHDIGKVGVKDAILLKPGPLTSAERAKITDHARIGGECIHQIQRRIGDSTFLKMAHEIALHHHERWDGTGYPIGLVGEAIPLSARIVAIADVYDALSVKRVYKEALPHAVCVERITAASGLQFDADLVEIFLSIEHEFREIAERFRDFQEPRKVAQDDPRDESRMTKEQEVLIESTVDGHSVDKNGQESTRPSLKVVAGM